MSAGELPYMKLWVKDLMADPDVLELDLEEFGAYMKLLTVAWMRGGIPAEPKGRQRLLKVTPARERALWSVIGHKWESNSNGHLINPRQERERAAALRVSKGAKKAAGTRWAGHAEKEAA